MDQTCDVKAIKENGYLSRWDLVEEKAGMSEEDHKILIGTQKFIERGNIFSLHIRKRQYDKQPYKCLSCRVASDLVCRFIVEHDIYIYKGNIWCCDEIMNIQFSASLCAPDCFEQLAKYIWDEYNGVVNDLKKEVEELPLI